MRSSAQACEDLLARLFTDAEFRARFRQDAQGVCRELGIDQTAMAGLAQIDWTGLELAARSYAHKRETYAGRKRRWWSLS
jgi:putative modified peptide